ncbi:MAG: aminopeptidase P family protein [Deltaproteobacteria bacterium]|nr:aminopeptidase P family protein [Deltaproteobacteria bacterium]
MSRQIVPLLRRARAEAILFWSLENIRYLCGFSGSDGALVATAEERFFLSDFRYQEQAGLELRGAEFVIYKQKLPGIFRLIRSLRVKRLGFEAAAMPFASYRQLKEGLPRVSLVPLTDALNRLRIRKDQEEVEKIRRAARIAAESFGDTRTRLRAGTPERKAAEYLDCRMRRHGAEKASFDTIVASGPRAALPHGAPTEKKLQPGETVIVDFGARFQGYASDETKTLILGEPDGRQREIYGIVRRAQEEAFRAIRPGVQMRRIDAAARGVIERAGYGKFFGHGTGHGVGLAVHEEPRLSPRGKGVAEEGMVFTVEPGIYLPGWGGVRLEDMVLVTKDGFEKLTYLSKEISENAGAGG